MVASREWTSTSLPYLTPRDPAAGDAWAEEAGTHGAKGSQRLAHVGEVIPPSEVIEAFDLPDGELVVARRRIIYLDDAPVELADTYYPLATARGTPLAEPRKIKGGAITLLGELGHLVARVVEDVTARKPAKSERALLDLAQDDPVLVLTRLSLDSSDRPIQVELMTAPAGIRRLRYELKVD